MANENVNDAHHLMRFVPYTQQERDPDTDEFLGILGTSFNVRPRDDGGISVTCVEHYGPKNAATYGAAASHFRDALEKKKLPPLGAFAIGNAGHTKEVCANTGKKIRIVEAPDGPNHGHVELRRFDDKDRSLLDRLANDVYDEHVLVKNLAQISLPAPCCPVATTSPSDDLQP